MLQHVGQKLLSSTIGVVGAQAFDLPHKVDFGNSLAMESLSNGVIYAGVNDVINYFQGNGSLIAGMQWTLLLDDVVFFSLVSGGVTKAKLDDQIANIAGGVVSDQQALGIAVEAGVLTVAQLFGEYIDSNPSLPSVLHNIRHPSRLLAN